MTHSTELRTSRRLLPNGTNVYEYFVGSTSILTITHEPTAEEIAEALQRYDNRRRKPEPESA